MRLRPPRHAGAVPGVRYNYRRDLRPGRGARGRVQKEDFYHVLKHKRKLRPDLMTDEERARAKQVSWPVKVHRFVTKPYFLIRRRTFKRLRETGQLAPEGSK